MADDSEAFESVFSELKRRRAAGENVAALVDDAVQRFPAREDDLRTLTSVQDILSAGLKDLLPPNVDPHKARDDPEQGE